MSHKRASLVKRLGKESFSDLGSINLNYETDSRVQSNLPFVPPPTTYSLGRVDFDYDTDSKTQNVTPYLGAAKESDFAHYSDLLYLGVSGIPKSRRVSDY